MTTIVVSDLHLGTRSDRDVLRRPESRAAFLARVAGADHVVLLGDAVELRDLPLAAALRAAEPLFRELGDALGSTPVTLVPGNHDHQFADPLIEAHRLDPDLGPLRPDSSMPAPPGGPVGQIAHWLGDAELHIAYPGIWLRDDVYATHGHYMDLHGTVPMLERLGAALSERLVGGLPRETRTPADYESALEPLYSLAFSLAQSSRPVRHLASTGASVRAYRRLSGSNGRRNVSALALGRVLLPGMVFALNRAGLGPLSADISGPSLRRSALRGIATALELLGVEPRYAIFGHTHRSGPWPADDAAEWKLADGGQLFNAGSWFYEPTFIGTDRTTSPYWPGTCVVVEEEGPPRLERLL
jgi:Calcineurin-like phosphoesterase